MSPNLRRFRTRPGAAALATVALTLVGTALALPGANGRLGRNPRRRAHRRRRCLGHPPRHHEHASRAGGLAEPEQHRRDRAAPPRHWPYRHQGGRRPPGRRGRRHPHDPRRQRARCATCGSWPTPITASSSTAGTRPSETRRWPAPIPTPWPASPPSTVASPRTRIKVSGVEDGVRLGDNSELRDSLSINCAGDDASHFDGVTADGGNRGWRMIHNTILNSHGQTGAVWVGDGATVDSEGVLPRQLHRRWRLLDLRWTGHRQAVSAQSTTCSRPATSRGPATGA